VSDSVANWVGSLSAALCSVSDTSRRFAFVNTPFQAEIAELKVGQFKLQAELSRLGGERDRLGNSLSKIKVEAVPTQPAKKKVKKENGCADNAQEEVIIIDD
jgi:hypothetical protein